jgi:hypothetical protein
MNYNRYTREIHPMVGEAAQGLEPREAPMRSILEMALLSF